MQGRTVKNSVKGRRERLEMSQVELAKLAGVGQSTICAIEKGKSYPYIDTALFIADALGCKVDDIFYLSEKS